MWESDRKESWALKKWCFWTVVLEKTLESLLASKEIKPVNNKGNQSWIFIGRTDAEAETPVLWKRPWCWERLKAGGEGDDRGWDVWMASLTGWTGVWASSRSWWWTEKSCMLQSMGSQRVGHDWVTELNGEVKVAQPCPTLCDPMNLPVSSVHGILQARMLEWFAIPFSRGSSQPRGQTQVSHIAGRFFTSWATRESPHIDKPQLVKWCTECHMSH